MPKTVASPEKGANHLFYDHNLTRVGSALEPPKTESLSTPPIGTKTGTINLGRATAWKGRICGRSVLILPDARDSRQRRGPRTRFRRLDRRIRRFSTDDERAKLRLDHDLPEDFGTLEWPLS